MQERQATQTERIQKAADTTQYIATIPAMTEGQDSEEYVTNLEKLLHQNNVPEEKWRQILSTKITPAAKAVVAEHFDDATCTFQDIRDALLRCKGLTSIEAIYPLYSQTISVDTAIPMITINKVDKWVSTMCKGVRTLAEMKNRWVTSRILAVLNLQLKEYLGSKTYTTKQELGAHIVDWHAIHGSQAETENLKVSTPQGSDSVKRGNRSSVDCFNCGKIGCRAVDCWSRRRPFGTPAPAN